MDETIKRELALGLTCDITTTGRASGQPRRIEIWYFVIDERVYITGTPGPRDWYANLLAQPHFVFHVKQGVRADLPAQAIPIADQVAHLIDGNILPRTSSGTVKKRCGDHVGCGYDLPAISESASTPIAAWHVPRR